MVAAAAATAKAAEVLAAAATVAEATAVVAEREVAELEAVATVNTGCYSRSYGQSASTSDGLPHS